MHIRVVANERTGHCQIPRAVKDSGFQGLMEVIVGSLCLIFLKPGTSKEDAIKSLELVIEGLRLEIKLQQEKDAAAKK